MIDLDLLLAEADTVAISGHSNPDGDCVGSCLGMYQYIRKCYPDKKVDLYLEPIPNVFKFLRDSDKIISDCSRDFSYDLFFSQDCGDKDRLGEAVKYFETAKVTVNIDHHISNPGFAQYNYVVPTASSTSELVFHLLPKEQIDRFIAECIYVGIVHDTGVFQYASTSRATMEAAGFLMECGIDYAKIVDETYFARTFAQNKILGTALLKSELHLGGRCISSVITKEEMERYQVLPRHLNGIVSQLRSTKGVEAAVFLYETAPNTFKVSMRSAKLVDVAEIAVLFGGGGHIRASGCTVIGDAAKMTAVFVAEIAKQLEAVS